MDLGTRWGTAYKGCSLWALRRCSADYGGLGIASQPQVRSGQARPGNSISISISIIIAIASAVSAIVVVAVATSSSTISYHGRKCDNDQQKRNAMRTSWKTGKKISSHQRLFCSLPIRAMMSILSMVMVWYGYGYGYGYGMQPR
ncbi:hypothetical protein BS50DRAFT_382951 [Corynespora cassiicola Philippines]|uniref:Uncharacterized protein n=1 Tax=Corynespora cassiicola Philippines TaxID=1448308 RepID=A0A2T2NNX7_CORCC|nr:hypothetical protein BS50DRAFT_382951 [Corynespora cassiicola Philippines]